MFGTNHLLTDPLAKKIVYTFLSCLWATPGSVARKSAVYVLSELESVDISSHSISVVARLMTDKCEYSYSMYIRQQAYRQH